LEQFKVVIFLNTTGDIFDSAQQKVMERFIQSGKGFVGIHSATDTEYDWDLV
jgi:type 1 glutamine amidotransferase